MNFPLWIQICISNFCSVSFRVNLSYYLVHWAVFRSYVNTKRQHMIFMENFLLSTQNAGEKVQKKTWPRSRRTGVSSNCSFNFRHLWLHFDPSQMTEVPTSYYYRANWSPPRPLSTPALNSDSLDITYLYIPYRALRRPSQQNLPLICLQQLLCWHR